MVRGIFQYSSLCTHHESETPTKSHIKQDYKHHLLDIAIEISELIAVLTRKSLTNEESHPLINLPNFVMLTE